tara:strand:- start:42 stop:317 length:276 start_codon:yes stop_codon:yes gene_type:complete
MNLVANIIDPNKRKTRVTCSECGLSYSAKNYKILYDNEKLAFFKMKLPEQRTKIFCHDCLHKVIYKYMGVLKEVKLQIFTLDETVTVIFKK